MQHCGNPTLMFMRLKVSGSYLAGNRRALRAFAYVPSCLEIGREEVKATATLLGSLAAVIATAAAAQATDFPAQAKAIDYVKVCPQYGAGFGYVFETAVCTR